MTPIGQYLRMGREERKIPIAQVSRDTRVSERYLAAIEAGEFSRFPAVAYARGFIKIYAEYLGLDPRPILEQFAHEYLAAAGGHPAPDGEAHTAVPRPWSGALIGAAAAGAIVAVVAGISMLLKPARAPRAPRPVPPGVEELETLPLPAIPATRPTLPPSSAPAAAPEPAKPKSKRLSVRAREPVALKVYADGALLYQGTLARGREESWSAAETFDLRVSRPRVAEIKLDGKPVRELKGRTAQNLRIGADGKIEAYRGKLKGE